MTTELVRPSDLRRCALYRHYDENDVLLYVGITETLGDRTNSGHARTSDWVQFARRAEAEWHDSRELASRAEREAVRYEEPIYNRQYAEWDVDRRIGEYLHKREVEELCAEIGEYERAARRFFEAAPAEDVAEADQRARAEHLQEGVPADRSLTARVLYHLARLTEERAAEIRDDASTEAYKAVVDFVIEKFEAIRDRRQASAEPPF